VLLALDAELDVPEPLGRGKPRDAVLVPVGSPRCWDFASVSPWLVHLYSLVVIDWFLMITEKPIKLSDLAQKLLWLDGKPFSLKDYPMYESIYNGRSVQLFSCVVAGG
jgi:hypothetical protein